jgi:hypothetical protein
MDKAALVNIDVQRGSEILDALDRAKLKVRVVLWALLPEYEDWRLVLASPQFDSVGLREAYGMVHDSLDPAGFTPEKTPSILILPMNDPSIKDLRRTFGKAKSVDGMRLGGQLFGDRFVRDAYVYRIS